MGQFSNQFSTYPQTDMFEGFKRVQIQASDPQVSIHLRYGGQGPGLLLLHGNPITHITWHKITPCLAQHFTVVASDLRGLR
jgi:haloacetate dehalogenase